MSDPPALTFPVAGSVQVTSLSATSTASGAMAIVLLSEMVLIVLWVSVTSIVPALISAGIMTINNKRLLAVDAAS